MFSASYGVVRKVVIREGLVVKYWKEMGYFAGSDKVGSKVAVQNDEAHGLQGPC